ncbi:MAG TPA: hypothetical protein P5511_09670, partial [Candidatus Goldiibacteriota bacterium]|nr:hypothetical protein [Candidatus Goldiibacteriota bacterium]
SYVSAIERIRDVFLDRQIITEMSNTGKWAELKRNFQLLSVIFPEVTGAPGGLQSKIDTFFADWQAIADAAAAGDAAAVNSAKAVLYSDATAFAQTMNTMSGSLKNLQLNITADMKTTIQNINYYSEQILAFNREIKFAFGSGQRPNDILDKRNEALTKLSELINIETTTRDDGSMVVHVNGHALVNGTDGINRLTTISGGTDTRLENVALVEQGKLNDITSYITGGKLGGMIESRDKVIKPYKDQLDNLASSLINVVNKIHRAGGTEMTDFFLGFKADTIMVNPALEDPAKINYSLFGANDIALAMANLGNKVLNNFVGTSSAAAFNQATTIRDILGMAPGDPDVNATLLINAVPVQYNTSETLETLINKINNNVTNFSIVFNP